eukprot:CAMPEP_0117009144 /NCGR_PEP_ID=MMETSP0472-20121206/8388_1 /TAXON_ID=693140 ORGANISM="Tiarina fusus, Strain LIS" /NCGR_SAMPLE_ID=MMETSP0472 /ASSEMBLY_ACC=CAM_ASM_000603 /LENGTH=769 /DNA_ID=CAMNT_0004711347 /DNA_START=485 /DNA_END=2794 /DNA_ORIENTATION=+
MKLTIALPVFAAFDVTTATLLRGSGNDFKSAVISASRNLDECVAPTHFGEDSVSTCCMPSQINHAVFQHESYWDEIKGRITGKGSGIDSQGNVLQTSYWHISIGSEPTDILATNYGGSLAGLQMSGWCVDLSRYASSGWYWLDVYSSYDDFPFDNVIDSPDKLPNVNWMINNYRLGVEYTVPGTFSDPHCGNSDATFTLGWETMQNAVWRTIDRGRVSIFGSEEGAAEYLENQGADDCLTYYMVHQNEMFGNYYEPSCDDVDAEIALLFIWDNDTADADSNTVQQQVIIGQARLHDVAGACTPIECCEELSIDHETFQDNKEIFVTISPGGANSAYEVAFLAGSNVYPDSLTAVDAWSVDLDRDAITEASTVLVDTYSTYDNWYRFNVVENKHNIPKVNYLINTWPVGTAISGCETSSVSVDDFQYAVWKLVDDDTTSSSCISDSLVADANINGVDYEPSCASGTTDKLAVLLLVDEEGAYKAKIMDSGAVENYVVRLEHVTGHVIIAEVPIASIPGACYMKDCNCCGELPEFPIGAPTSLFNDPTGEAPVVELSSAPVVAPFTPSPVDEIITPPPTPPPVSRPTAVCADPVEIMGSTFGAQCAHQGVTVLGSSTGPGSPALSIDILDTVFGIDTGGGDTSVDFRMQNPFSGGSVEMYVEYQKTDGGVGSVPSIQCDSDPTVDECQAFGDADGSVFRAYCVNPRSNDPSKVPYAVVTAYFVETGDDLFDFTTTNNVPECCEPDETNTGTVVAYTFEIMCTCPGGPGALN